MTKHLSYRIFNAAKTIMLLLWIIVIVYDMQISISNIREIFSIGVIFIQFNIKLHNMYENKTRLYIPFDISLNIIY